MIPNVRAWDKTIHRMCELININFEDELVVYKDWEYGISEEISFGDVEFLQSTGLLDKNGKEIFEGHIVKDTDGYVGYIAFLKQEMGYVVVYKTYDKRLGHRYRLDDGLLEILGNIYQDKHLLGED